MNRERRTNGVFIYLITIKSFRTETEILKWIILAAHNIHQISVCVDVGVCIYLHVVILILHACKTGHTQKINIPTR